jgi:hypothetical protein
MPNHFWVMLSGTSEVTALMPKPCLTPLGEAQGPCMSAAFMTSLTRRHPVVRHQSQTAAAKRVKVVHFRQGFVRRHRHGAVDARRRFFRLSITSTPAPTSTRAAVRAKASEIQQPVWANVSQNVRTSLGALSAARRKSPRSAGVMYLRFPPRS